MISLSCIYVVRHEFEKFGFTIEMIKLGLVQIREPLDDNVRKELSVQLRKYDLEITEEWNPDVEQIKRVVIEYFQKNENISGKINWADLLKGSIGKKCTYSYISHLFSNMEGVTLERYIIKQKIIAVKRLLLNQQLKLKEITKKMGYKNISHLSYQFKKVTGQTPSEFKKSKFDTGIRE
ncbi:helix-turn-helix domain-containing protein [Arcticibacter tournemirensis]|nr:AraC family transcriptional regulator [Arcticibacter tournemirensis]